MDDLIDGASIPQCWLGYELELLQTLDTFDYSSNTIKSVKLLNNLLINIHRKLISMNSEQMYGH